MKYKNHTIQKKFYSVSIYTMIEIITKNRIKKLKSQSLEEGRVICKQDILQLLKEEKFEINGFISKLMPFLDTKRTNVAYDDIDINTMKNHKLKTILPNGERLTSDAIWYNNVRAISKLLWTPLYGYQEVGQMIVDIRPKMRWVCGAWPEFGHNDCADCFRERGWPEDTWETESVREPVFDRVEITPRKHEEVHMYMQGEIEKPTQREMDISTISHTLQLLFADLKSPLQNTLIDIYNLAKRCNCTREEIQALSTDERRQKFVDRMCIDIP